MGFPEIYFGFYPEFTTKFREGISSSATPKIPPIAPFSDTPGTASTTIKHSLSFGCF
jgi:hypothetical protein